MKLSKKDFYIVFFLFVITIVLSLIVVDFSSHDWGGDFSQYIAQSLAIVNNNVYEWYNNNSFIVNNSITGLAPLAYPWGYPLILAITISLFGNNLAYFKITNIVIFAIFVVFLYLWLRRRIEDRKHVVLLALLVVFNYSLLSFQNYVLSDVPCMAFIMMALFVFDLYKDSNEKHKYIYGLLLGILIFFSYFIRTQALALLVALLIYDIIEIVCNRNKKLKINAIIEKYCLPYIGFLILYIINKIVFPSGSTTYLSFFDNINVKNIMLNIKDYIIVLCDFFSIDKNVLTLIKGEPQIVKIAIKSFKMVFGILFIIGFFKSFRKNLFSCIYFSVTMALLIIYPFFQGSRFVFEIIFIFEYFCYLGYITITENKKILYVFTIIFILLNIITVGNNNSFRESSKLSKQNNAYSDEAKEMYNYIIENTKSDDIVYFFKPRVLFLNTGRISFNDLNNIEKASYIVYSSLIDNEDRNMFINKKECFSNDLFTVYFNNSLK